MQHSPPSYSFWRWSLTISTDMYPSLAYLFVYRPQIVFVIVRLMYGVLFVLHSYLLFDPSFLRWPLTTPLSIRAHQPACCHIHAMCGPIMFHCLRPSLSFVFVCCKRVTQLTISLYCRSLIKAFLLHSVILLCAVFITQVKST